MGLKHVLNLLQISNSDLPRLECVYNNLRQEINSLHNRKVELNNRVTTEHSNLEYYRVACQRQIDKFNEVRHRREKEEALATCIERNDPGYIKIRKAVEDKVCTTLSDAKPFIYLAIFCLIESIKENPDRYSPLIEENMPLMKGQGFPYFAYYPYAHEQHRPNYYDAKTMLQENAAKMYNRMSKSLADDILNYYPTSKPPQPDLLPLPSPGE